MAHNMNGGKVWWFWLFNDRVRKHDSPWNGRRMGIRLLNQTEERDWKLDGFGRRLRKRRMGRVRRRHQWWGVIWSRRDHNAKRMQG
jgi:hypothetical protein